MKYIHKIPNILAAAFIIERVQYDRKFFSKMEYETIKSMVEREIDIADYSATSILNHRFILKLLAAILAWTIAAIVIFYWFHDIFRQSGLLMLTCLLILQALFFSFNFFYYYSTFRNADEERIKYVRRIEALIMETHNYEEFCYFMWGMRHENEQTS